MLHIHGGSVLLDLLRQARLPGAFLEWCDVLCQGPTPAGLTPEAWRITRAAYLDRAFGGAVAGSHLARLTEQDRRLESSRGEDEVVLWFGPEFFCQAILLYLLDRFSHPDLSRVRLSLVCIGSHPAVPESRGCTLSYLSPEDLAALWERRPEVTSAQRSLARRAWAAFTAPTPFYLERLLADDLSPLPFLGETILRHLQEFPSVEDGLGLADYHALQVVRGGESDAEGVFRQVARLEARPWMTDLMLLARLTALAAGPVPLLNLESASSPASLAGTSVQLTAAGERVVAGRGDWLELGGVEPWLGGVRLSRSAPWRWDRAGGRLVHARVS